MKKKTPRALAPKRIPTSEQNLLKASQRLLSQRLVSTEIEYCQRTLGASATQDDIDAKVLEVRGMKWSNIAQAD